MDGGSAIPTVFAPMADGGADNGFAGDGQLDVPLTAQNFGAFTGVRIDPVTGRVVLGGWAFQSSAAGSQDAAAAVTDANGTSSPGKAHPRHRRP